MLDTALPRAPFPTVVSNSIISEFVTCPQRAYIRYILGRGTAEPNVHLDFGSIFASALEAARRAFYEQGQDQTTALNAGLQRIVDLWPKDNPWPDEKAKTFDNCLLSLMEYCDTYPFATDPLQPLAMADDRRTVEFTFVEPLEACRHPETDEPILLSGKFDMLAAHRHYHSQRWIVDEKTAAKKWHNWTDQWTIRSQFPCYSWGAAQAGFGPINGAWVRGVIIYQDHTETQDIPILIEPWKVDRWLHWTITVVNNMIECWRNDYWPYNFGTACALRGSSCPFLPTCTARDPNPYLARLPASTYEPLRLEVE